MCAHMYAHACGGQKQASETLELELHGCQLPCPGAGIWAPMMILSSKHWAIFIPSMWVLNMYVTQINKLNTNGLHI